MLIYDKPEIQINSVMNDTLLDINGTGVSIRYASRFYNGAVMEYNKQLSKFPSYILKILPGYREMIFFEPEGLKIPVEDEVRI
jgi:hypothetical protein